MPHRAERTRRQLRMATYLGIARKTPGKVPRQVPPRLIERDYGRALAAYLGARTRAAFAPLLAELPRLLEQAAAARRSTLDARTDAGETERVRALLASAKASLRASIKGEELADLARRFASQTSTHQRIQFNRQTRSALGVDVLANTPGLPPLVEGWTAANVALAEGLADRVSVEVSGAVMAAVQDGRLWPDVAKDLETRLGIPERRAQFIARDQVGKLYGQINAARQREAGVTRFRWRTVRDERVRGDPDGKYPNVPDDEDHYAREGEIYEYADPPNGELPGEPILCRCSAEPVLEDLLDGLDEL